MFRRKRQERRDGEGEKGRRRQLGRSRELSSRPAQLILKLSKTRLTVLSLLLSIPLLLLAVPLSSSLLLRTSPLLALTWRRAVVASLLAAPLLVALLLAVVPLPMLLLLGWVRLRGVVCALGLLRIGRVGVGVVRR